MSDKPAEIGMDSAEIGKRYLVKFSDCCVNGSFEAVLTNKVPVDDDNPDWIDVVAFDNGVVIGGLSIGLTELAPAGSHD